MIDIPALRVLLEKAMHQPPWCLHDDRMGKGIGAQTTKYNIGDMEFDDDSRLAVAAVNALPPLLTVFEAALAVCTSKNPEQDLVCRRALIAAVDAARRAP